MKKISLTEIEIKDLLDLYQTEVDRAQRRVNNLNALIKKLSEGESFESTDEKPAKVKDKRGRKPNVKTVEVKTVNEAKEKEITKEPKKRGRKKKVTEVKVEPKKRGRKPKTKTIETQVAKATKEVKGKVITKEPKKIEKKEKTAKIKVEPKKRGRKPKVQNAEVNVAKAVKEVKEKEITKKPKKIARKKKIAKVKVAPKKRGRKPKSLRKPIKGGKGKEKVKWNDFIIETITSKDSLLLASSITQAALEKFEIPTSDRDRVRMAISTTLTKMANKDKILQAYTQPGIRGAFFGLAAWFNDKAELSVDYQKKLM